MKTKHYLSLFFCSTLLALQLISALHFIVVEHSFSDEKNKNVITHNCDEYILYPNFTTTDISFPIYTWITNNKILKVEKIFIEEKVSTFNALITNKGPPFVEKIST